MKFRKNLQFLSRLESDRTIDLGGWCRERGFGLGLNAWVGGELSGRGQGTHFGWGTKFVVTANFFCVWGRTF